MTQDFTEGVWDCVGTFKARQQVPPLVVICTWTLTHAESNWIETYSSFMFQRLCVHFFLYASGKWLTNWHPHPSRPTPLLQTLREPRGDTMAALRTVPTWKMMTLMYLNTTLCHALGSIMLCSFLYKAQEEWVFLHECVCEFCKWTTSVLFWAVCT